MLMGQYDAVVCEKPIWPQLGLLCCWSGYHCVEDQVRTEGLVQAKHRHTILTEGLVQAKHRHTILSIILITYTSWHRWIGLHRMYPKVSTTTTSWTPVQSNPSSDHLMGTSTVQSIIRPPHGDQQQPSPGVHSNNHHQVSIATTITRCP